MKEMKEKKENIKTEASENKYEEIIPDVYKVTVNYVSGQHFHYLKTLKAYYINCEPSEIAKSISELVKPFWDDDNSSGDNFYIECENEYLKQQLIAETIRKQPKLIISTKRNEFGSSFGYNIDIELQDIHNTTLKENK